MITHDEDASDPQVPLLIWWAIEAHCDGSREKVVDFLSDVSAWKHPIISGTVLSRAMQRFALEAVLTSDVNRKAQLFQACETLFRVAPDTDRPTLSEGFLEAFAGRDLSSVPPKSRGTCRCLAAGQPALI